MRYGQSVRDPIRIGQYEVHEAIASGGMATVHFGRFSGPAGFARTVAVKRMHPHLCNDPEFVAMFVDEALLAARIRHPNVVPTLDVLATDGELLIVMEYVHGEPLAQLARRIADRKGRIPPAIAAAVLCDLLAGLHAAHEATDERGESLGIIHRDVSPENVLVGLDGYARVLDFGVAKAIGRLQVTREGQVKGKIAYMAPEQVRGAGIDRRADIYAASVVLWQLLTGRRLFDGARDGELVERILFGTIDAPATLAPHVPEAFNGIVLRGLARDPAERFPTAREMAQAIRDAVRPASASELSDWVEATAGELAARAAILAAIDREHGAEDPGLPPGQPIAPVSSGEPDRLAVVLHTDVPSSRPRSAARSAERRTRIGRASAMAGAVVALGAVSVFVARPRAEKPPHPTVVQSKAQDEDPSGLASAPLATSPEHPPASPSTSPRIALRPEAADPPPAAPPVPTASSPPKRMTAPPSPSVGAHGRISCDPPFTTDADGTRIYKMQCL